MKPIGALMIEHRTIEGMVALLAAELTKIKGGKAADTVLINAAVDFFRVYADRTHHGKEEDILFKALEKKTLTPELGRIMQELIAEHVIARKTVGALKDAGDAYAGGSHHYLDVIIENLGKLVELYPKHIAKEDRNFFKPVQELFDQTEQEAMLQAFRDFDRNMIHEKYQHIIAEMKQRAG
jgi:hemerythrin-like domain-containing protein